MRFFKVLAVIAAGICILGSCRSTRSSRKIQQAISKPKDTTAIVIVHKDEHPDSLVKLHAVLQGMYAHHIEYTTFQAKMKVDYSNQQGHQPNFTANIRMKKDSVIWIDISGPFGINAFRVLITQDTLRILNELKHTYQVRSLGYLKEVAEIPFDFKTIQNLLVGNLIFFDSTRISAYRPGSGSTFLLSAGDLFKNLVTLANGDNRVLHSKLDDVDPTRSRTADLTFDDYVSKGGILFATTRSIGISEKTQVDIELNFKQFDFNVPLSYPFNIPKKYKRIK
jgi:hypothetical protein